MSNIDPIDKMLQGEDTPSASQAQTPGQQDDSIQRIEQQTEEEVEFNKLSGPAQERFRSALVRAREAEERLSELQSRQQFVPQQQQNMLAPDQKQAIDTLSQFGITTDEKMKSEVKSAKQEILDQFKYQNLETKYSGQNGEPQFVREDIENYVKNHPQYKAYDPEDVFKFKMYPDEFNAIGTQRQAAKPKTTSLKPTKSYGQASAITPENVEELVASHNEEWFDAHHEEINAAVAAHTNQFKGQNFGGQ